MTDSDHLAKLQAENARLIALLEANAIEWRPPAEVPATPVSVVELPSQSFGTKEKLRLFRRLFHGRTDVFPQRWESKTGKAGYSPACANEWRPGVCQKPRVKCGECNHRQLHSAKL